MKIVTLVAKTEAAAEKIEKFGDSWEVKGETQNPDLHFFQSKKPHLYLVPRITKSSRHREDIGIHYRAPQNPRNIGAMWIREKDDPNFGIEAAV